MCPARPGPVAHGGAGVRWHDAGGGHTYAAHYDLNGVTYFNNAPEGVLNTYTIAAS